jgi:hypothetical protein
MATRARRRWRIGQRTAARGSLRFSNFEVGGLREPSRRPLRRDRVASLSRTPAALPGVVSEARFQRQKSAGETADEPVWLSAVCCSKRHLIPNLWNRIVASVFPVSSVTSDPSRYLAGDARSFPFENDCTGASIQALVLNQFPA